MTDALEKYRTNTVVLNIREAPISTAKVLGHLIRGQVIERIDISADGNWIKHKSKELTGWSSKKYLLQLTSLPLPGTKFPWMQIAESEKGVMEIPGKENSARVVEYLKTVTNIGPAWVSRDETHWCSAFVNWCMEKAGIVGTKSALATSWLKWGQPISTPVKGCLAIFERDHGGGHVGFFLEEVPTLTEKYIKVLGGNQEHADTEIGEVNEKHYRKSKLLGYRIPSEYSTNLA